MVAVDRNRERKRTVRGIVTRQMRVRLRVAEIVDGDDLQVRAPVVFIQRAQDVASDAAIPVDCDFYRHTCLP